MIKVDAMGDTCPIPVVKTKNAIKELKGSGEVQTLVDNEPDENGKSERLWCEISETGRRKI